MALQVDECLMRSLNMVSSSCVFMVVGILVRVPDYDGGVFPAPAKIMEMIIISKNKLMVKPIIRALGFNDVEIYNSRA